MPQLRDSGDYMAKVILVSRTNNSMKVRIDELSYAQSQYGGFRYRLNNSVWILQDSQSGSMSNSSPEIEFINLAAGSYLVEAQGLFNGVWYDVDSLNTSIPLPAPSALSAITGSTTSINVSWGAVTGATRYDVEIIGSTSRSTLYNSISLTDLTPNTTYYIRVRAYSVATGYSDWSSTVQATTNSTPPEPTLTAPTILSAYATNSGEIYVSWGTVTNAASYEVRLLVGGAVATTRTTTNTSIYVGNLTAETTYSVSVRAQSASGAYSNYSSERFVTTSSARPQDFSWFTAKLSGETFNLTATEWNTFTARINAFRTYKSLTVYSFTSAVSENSLTATMYNEARNAISAMSPSTALPAARESGDTIYASDLNTLVSSLNSIT